MKKILLSLTALIALSTSAQVEIRLDGVGADISGTVHSIDLYPGSPDLVGGIYQVHFDVTNLTGSDQQWRVTRKKLNVPTTWIDQVCWPPLCYNANGDIYVTPNSGGNPAPTILNGTAMTANAEVAEIKPRITVDQSSASYGLYRYYVTDLSGAFLDSIDVSVNFVLGLTPLKQTLSAVVSPNPADENISINLTGIENASVKIVDVLGNSVFSETISNGSKSVDVSNFKNGVYFVLIESSGIKSITRKLIIRH